MTLAEKDIRRLQRAMNAFTELHKGLGHPSIKVDGELGKLTKKRLGDVKYDLGYPRESIDSTVDEAFYWRMLHPDRPNFKYHITKAGVKRGKQRRARRRRAVRRLHIVAFLHPGVGKFDGIPVAKCAIPVLQWCREHGWPGHLTSGWRSGPYSESLCYRMCGQPTCAGRCAGRNTNHTGTGPDRFAVDVSEYVKFATVVAECSIHPHIHNSLPFDRLHFSPSGN